MCLFENYFRNDPVTYRKRLMSQSSLNINWLTEQRERQPMLMYWEPILFMFTWNKWRINCNGSRSVSQNRTYAPTFWGAHRVIAGRFLNAPCVRTGCQAIHTSPTDDTTQRQQALRNCTLNGLYKASSAHDTVAARWRLHRCACIDAYDALIFLRGWRLRFIFLQFIQ